MSAVAHTKLRVEDDTLSALLCFSVYSRQRLPQSSHALSLSKVQIATARNLVMASNIQYRMFTLRSAFCSCWLWQEAGTQQQPHLIGGELRYNL